MRRAVLRQCGLSRLVCAVAAAGVLLGDAYNVVSCSQAVRGAKQLLLAFDLKEQPNATDSSLAGQRAWSGHSTMP